MIKCHFMTYVAATLLLTAYHPLQAGFFQELGKPLTDMPKTYQWKKEMTAKLSSIYNTIMPKDEQRMWKSTGEEDFFFGDVDEIAGGAWIPRGDKKFYWSEKVKILIENTRYNKKPSDKVPASINEVLENYKYELNKAEDYIYSIKLINSTQTEVLIVLTANKKGTSGLVKKDKEVISIEKIVFLEGWTFHLMYEFAAFVDKDKATSWDQLKETWIKRFNQVKFQ